MGKEPRSKQLPKIIEIETTINCPINPPCIMCERAAFKDVLPKKFVNEYDISQDLIEKIKPLLANAKEVSLHVGGEPLACKNLFKITELANPNAYISFASNGLLLNYEKINKILKSNIKYISFSIDAATEKTYARIRLNAFKKVINNISNLIMARNSGGHQCPKVVPNMTLMKENFREILDFVRLAKDMGADGVQFHPLNKQGIIKENQKNGFIFKAEEQALDKYIQEVKNLLKKAKNLAGKHNLSFSSYGFTFEDAGENNKSFLCHDCNAPWERILILLSGDAKFCCFSNEILGNLKTQSFEQVWNSEKAIQIRAGLISGIMPESCRCKTNLPY